MVGIGLGVGVVGGGAMHALSSSFMMVPNWHSHTYAGSSSVEVSTHLAKSGHWTVSHGLGQASMDHVLHSSTVSLYWLLWHDSSYSSSKRGRLDSSVGSGEEEAARFLRLLPVIRGRKCHFGLIVRVQWNHT